ncbi:MAG: putative lipid II flippase FtsW [Lachnospiraceae bacterium]|jgi:cell division protein FtsW|nr:putative lipid II flippase FtsW [Lachnospiraceae bacterium]MCI1328151.1 putative lipid II flippase FtsW [Lachnospiraceae bacterium]
MPKGKKARTMRGRGDFYDYSLLAVVIILICFGLVMLYSASAYEAATSSISDDMFYFRRQAVFDVLAVVLAIIISNLKKADYHFAIRIAPAVYVAALLLMAMVRYSPLGRSAGGARRWLYLGVQFQPSEIAKIAVILSTAYLILRIGKNMGTVKAFLVLIGFGAVQAFGAFYLTDNLSTGIIIMGICFFMVFLASPNTRRYLVLFLGIAAAVALGLFAINRTFSSSSNFRLRRILVWLHPEKYLASGGYQVMQGLYAIGSGGLFGKGLGNSTQKLSTIPEAQNDMIFSIICEELGLFGAIIVLILFAYLLYRLFFIAQNAPDLYGTLIVSGVFIHIALQVILNICVVLNLIPTTGVTLPFVSYGGTSVIFLMIEIGLSLNVARQIRFQDEPGREGAENEYPISERNSAKWQ